MQGTTEASAHRSADARRYNRIRIGISLAEKAISLALLGAFAFTGISRELDAFLETYFADPYLRFMIFIGAIGLASGTAGFPLDMYGGYFLEHRFGLSNQSFGAWVTDRLKSLAVGLLLGAPVALAFFFFLRESGGAWWLYFATAVFFLSVLLARAAPALIFPIFYRFTPLEDRALADRLSDITSRLGIVISGIYVFDLSRETKKANAGFTGIGRGRRIVLSDTLLRNFSTDEIAVIFAHEAGHYLKRHIAKNILLGGLILYISFFACGALYDRTLQALGFVNLHDIAATPVLFLYLAALALIVMPLMNALSRRFEREADRAALDITRDRDSFISAMEKLTDMNLSEREPGRLTEALLHSHPSTGRRIEMARNHPL